MSPSSKSAYSPDTSHFDPVRLVCSYPKTGRTWLRFMLANYLNEVYRLGYELSLQNVYDIVPNFETNIHGRGIASSPIKGTAPMIAMDHSTYDSYSHGHAATVLLVRNPMDVMVSHWLHAKYHYENTIGSLDSFIRDSRNGISSYMRYLESWDEPVRENRCHVVTYEDLHQDPDGHLMEVIIELLGEADRRAIGMATSRSTFDEMSNLESRYGMKGISYDYRNPDARRVRRGVVGGYRDYLTPNDIQYIESQLTTSDSTLLASTREKWKSL